MLRYLPAFEQPRRDFIQDWKGLENGIFPHPAYDEDVLEFFNLAGQHHWSDYRYQPQEAYRMLQDDSHIAEASLAQIKTMLTYCVRSERFASGSWGNLLNTGRVIALLRRLGEIHADL